MDPDRAPPPWPRIHRTILGFLLLAGLGAVLLAPSDWLVGSAPADLGQQFLAWRAFATESLRAGRLPLWNPYSYAGEPFLGGFQSALFYPPNLIFLVLPLCRALNLSVFLHLFLLGAGMDRWARHRGLHPLAAGLCGLALPLGGSVFPHVYAGHLSNLCSLAWTPWILGSLDDWYRGGVRRDLLLASAAVGLQIFAGQTQYVFYTAVAAGLHAAAFSMASPAARLRALPAAAAGYFGGAALAAAQLIPGLTAAAEGLRQGRLDASFVGQFSLPPENLLTFVTPGFFGDPVRHLYWGRGYPWDMSVFVGVSGMILAMVGAADARRRRSAGLCLGLAGLLLLPALGRHTPFFRPLYEFAPGFDRFRGWSKFTFPATIFIVLAIGIGTDALLRRRPPARVVALGAVATGILATAAGLCLWWHPSSLGPLLRWIRDSGESYLPRAAFTDPGIVQAAGVQAGRSLAIAGAVAILSGGSLALARSRPAFVWVVVGLLPVELIGFATTQFAHFRRDEAVLPELTAFVAAHPGDYRVQNLLAPNNGFLTGAPDLWGNDPALLRRYAEFIAFTQGGDPNRATQNVDFRTLPSLYRLLRLHYVFTGSPTGPKVYDVPGAMDRVQLLSDYRVLPSRDAIFSAMSQPDFDPGRTVLLESPPGFDSSQDFHPGIARILSTSADQFTVEADVTAPSLLLVTDAYSRDWHARPLTGSSQAHYEVVPADYAVRATPLAVGHHLIRFEYVPTGLRAGLAISALAWAGWLALWASRPVRRHPV